MSIVFMAIRIFEFILILRVIMSWIPFDKNHPVAQWIYKLTEPVLEPIRRFLPGNGMGIDFSPLIVFILLQVIKRLIISYVPF